MTLLRDLSRAKTTFQARTLHTILTEGKDMTDHLHPMRAAVFHAYVRQDGKQAIVRADPPGLCPCIFVAPTADEALAKAEAFRAIAVADNEAAYHARQAAMTKSREARDAKKAAEENT